MRLRIVRWFHRRAGERYWLVVGLAQGGAATLVTVVTVLVAATFFDPSWSSVALVAGVAALCTDLSVLYAALVVRDEIRRFHAWRADPDPTPEETAEVWHLAVTGTWQQFRGNAGRVSFAATVPTVALAAWLWDTGWAGAGAMLLACVVPAYYGTVVSYSVGELLARPLVEEVAQRLPQEFAFRPGGLSLSRRLRLAFPAYTTTASMLTVGLLGHEAGASALATATLVSLAVGIGLSTELAMLMKDAVTEPVQQVRGQLARVRRGDFDARTPVLTGDELGELAHDVNQMAQGLAEREQIREAFGTYLDKAVVELILSGEFPPEGVETEASILFCDVRGFTTYAEGASAAEVIATLNEMFSVIVPIVESHGGHVDKFLGDGLLAVFGTPREYADHADRAVAAACQIAEVDVLEESGLTVGVGVNSGTVVAGPLGGAGRLNFSVIGDAVNTAARVEAATRRTGDDVLITEATRALLTGERELRPRGAIELKGKTEPVELYAPVVAGVDDPARRPRPPRLPGFPWPSSLRFGS